LWGIWVTGDCEVFEWLEIVRYLSDWRLWGIWVTGECEVFEWREIVRYLSDWRLWGIWVTGDCEVFEWQESVRDLSDWRLWGIWVTGDCEVFEWREIVRYLSDGRLWGIWVTGDCEVPWVGTATSRVPPSVHVRTFSKPSLSILADSKISISGSELGWRKLDSQLYHLATQLPWSCTLVFIVVHVHISGCFEHRDLWTLTWDRY